MATLQAGARVGRYEVVSLLGVGGMGEVYRARDTQLARNVAIKVLPTEFAAEPARLQRFEQEARAIASLSHPNVVSVFDLGREPVPFFVTELFEGETLAETLERGAVAHRRLVEIAMQLTAGLAAAHAPGR
jgi:serine/threonine-protein kinase